MSGQSLKRLLNRYSRSSAKKQQSRYLTVGEIALARLVFGDSLKLDEVRLKTTWWVLKNYAVSPNGNIYFNPADWIDDFSAASLGKQSWLIHELTHVWQLQQGLKVVRGALIDRRYDYVLETGKSFFEYGIEQQARMVQDYFVRHQRGQDCQDLEACIPFLTINTLTDIKNTNHASSA
ncbi:type IV secretion protein Rhs [Psychrobacter sp. Ps6]|uniref:type IV secretion protein Rhs n=1 Tax=Psychrobacter sp. Ps6 TaxID=2790960 RepID=UPI001EDF6BC9|nr:type IV secretion protein Rhs [Psychrobacter sp. Ps6]MCG3878061.1 type IV secretion protein Rhs [Psychrobacter sp. Ps6]